MILSVLNANKGAIIGTFIAIGAYSKDSLFFQLIFPENKFSVNAQMAMVSPLNQGIGYVLNSDSTNSTKLMTAVNLILYLDIKNNTNINQFLEGIELECEDSTGKWQNLSLKSLKPHEDFYFPMGKDSASLIKFSDDNLLDILGKSPISSNTVLSGYLMTESFIYSENLTYSPNNFKITFHNGFNKPETQEFTIKQKKQYFYRFRQILWNNEHKKISIKEYKLAPESNFTPNF